MADILEAADGTQFSCPLCKEHREEAAHLFLQCYVSKMVWRTGRWPLRLEAFEGKPIQYWLAHVLEPRYFPQDHRQH